ncbi:MAG: Activator of Hsp90 ATPase 1 family protein [Bacteroidetes bacterium]|nr:MAG: Activator of Hsp90 ATPase 1 family protein [Bacteroidota bacterium]
MTYSIKHLFHINAKPGDVYKAISSIEGLQNWWTIETSGNTEQNRIIHFRFGANGGPDMKVTESKPGEKVCWQCVSSPHGWLDHTFTFLLDENEGKTRVRFSHAGWKETDDFYAICSFSWGRYMESLRQFCQTGKGEAFGTDGYRK